MRRDDLPRAIRPLRFASFTGYIKAKESREPTHNRELSSTRNELQIFPCSGYDCGGCSGPADPRHRCRIHCHRHDFSSLSRRRGSCKPSQHRQKCSRERKLRRRSWSASCELWLCSLLPEPSELGHVVHCIRRWRVSGQYPGIGSGGLG